MSFWPACGVRRRIEQPVEVGRDDAAVIAAGDFDVRDVDPELFIFSTIARTRTLPTA
jgi:hypothetical protein